MSDTQHQQTAANDQTPLVIGLTGGIGSGKSTVADYFADLGITVVDADRIARQLVTPDQPAYAEIVATFGDQAVTSDGALDRHFLRARIHSNPDDKQKLEAILHPRIRRRMEALLKAAASPYCIAVIPLLVETGQADMVDRILVVDTRENLQRKRVSARDGLSDSAVSDIMASQIDRNARLAVADDIITNDSDLESLRTRVHQLHAQYRSMANA